MKSLITKIRKKLFEKKSNHFDDIVYIKNYKCAYFAIPKVANSSLKGVAVQLLGDLIPKDIQRIDKPIFSLRDEAARVRMKHENILVNFEYLRQQQAVYKFTFVRNPWDRLLSCYSNKILKSGEEKKNFVNGVAQPLLRFKCFYGGMPFSEFAKKVSSIPDQIADIHFKSQYLFLTDEKGRCAVDFIGKFEQLESDFKFLSEQLDFPSEIELPHYIKSNHKNYTEYYTEELIEIVAKRYAKDIALYKYTFGK